MGMPLHFWVDTSFMSIGEAIGEVQVIDLDGGRVQLRIDAFKALIFNTIVEFQGGIETMVKLRFERLYAFCRECNSPCHDSGKCPLLYPKRERQEKHRYKDDRNQGEAASYKGALQDKMGSLGSVSDLQLSTEASVQGKGKGKVSEYQEGRNGQTYGTRFGGDKSGGPRQPGRVFPPKEMRQRFRGSSRGISRGNNVLTQK
ncbi:unnamed protein product [Thlaspi arvense]|uniref:Zinc knuckle CX2CX4HX4C domain-containing protein n=1 Tax=Thlaspi arvense TaxID=13288 RepID=A0AAU9SU10_THLAR|nr:unnamed protein product [Thlaspi arvense]